jgi:integrase/recombinase XerD
MMEGVNIMKDFLNYLRTVRKRNEKTLKQYRSILKHFIGYEPVTWSSFTRYLESIKDNAPKTQRNKITLVKEYITWKLKTGRLELDEKTIMLI